MTAPREDPQVPANKKATPAKKKAKKAKKKAKAFVQVQLYMDPGAVRELDREVQRRKSEVRDLIGDKPRVSRSSHGVSILERYLQARRANPDLSYQAFWDAACAATAAKETE